MSAVAAPLERPVERLPALRVDPWMLLLTAAILLLGLVMVTSASVTAAARESGDPFAYLERQLVLVAGGLTLAASSENRNWRRAMAPIAATWPSSALSTAVPHRRKMRAFEAA